MKFFGWWFRIELTTSTHPFLSNFNRPTSTKKCEIVVMSETHSAPLSGPSTPSRVESTSGSPPRPPVPTQGAEIQPITGPGSTPVEMADIEALENAIVNAPSPEARTSLRPPMFRPFLRPASLPLLLNGSSRLLLGLTILLLISALLRQYPAASNQAPTPLAYNPEAPLNNLSARLQELPLVYNQEGPRKNFVNVEQEWVFVEWKGAVCLVEIAGI
jgi:hypothetical protein